MKTYLTLWFNSEGDRITKVTDRLMSLGFRPMKGTYDYVYDWPRMSNTNDLLRFGDQVHQTLKGCNVMFKLETL